MASEGSTQAIIKRRQDELALMPPPPVKRIKRPSKVLDEDDYTDALSDIIARDYYPGLREAEAQEQYLDALQSKNPGWIKEAEAKLQAVTSGTDAHIKRNEWRREQTDGDIQLPYVPAGDTPRGLTGADTPIILKGTGEEIDLAPKQRVDTTNLGLSQYQAKYTSEDNASFNTVLDRQNEKRRQKHAYLWTSDQKLLSQGQIKQRTQQQDLLKDKAEYKSVNGRELISITTGATSDRTAKPNAWKVKTPNNNFMFTPSTSVDEEGLPTVMDLKESMSRAGPKEIVHENTRFPPSGPSYSAEENDDATSIHTSFIARRNGAGTDIGTVTGAETPRVNGYSFVDEDEEPPPPSKLSEPSYRDLLAGQAADGTPNPFKLKENRKREDLHHKLVEQDAEKKRSKEKERIPGGKEMGNMTPAGRKLMERIAGRTPVPSQRLASSQRREDWTPVTTPRRNRAVAK
ncbi:hypothetical protein H2198_000796 [Neophaeococcomyces mojaviensis]|uniref:Uncharacterized protein n=1 Tax=Neophaeococcomyces mojaviensis TaxID=3383035 RepID=A0ACC3AIY7_9EURO|nr:hypothetical protein H2198_000796 [Knufia sp. JES_112]